MTAPFTDWTGQFGTGSQGYQDQLNSFNAMRDAFLQAQLQQRYAMSGGMTQQPVQGVTYPQTHQAPPAGPEWHDDDLVAAAMFWGIPEEQARAMPREAVMQFVNEQKAGQQGISGLSQEQQMLSSFGLGIAQGVTGGLRNLPVIGPALDRIDLLHNADMKLRMMEHAIQTTMPQDQEWMAKGANVAGNLATLWYPGNAAWAVAGKMGQIVPFLKGSRVAMNAFQGGASAYLLEGNSDHFKTAPLLTIGLGAGLGAGIPVAAGWVADRLATRVAKSFVPDDLLGPMLGPDVPQGFSPRMMNPETMEIPTNILSDQERALRLAAQGGDEQAAEMLRYLETQQTPEIGMRRNTGMEIPMQQGQVMHHFGTYNGGPGNPSASILGEEGSMGRGLYFAAEQDPSYVPAIGMNSPRINDSAWRSFLISDKAKYLDMDGPIPEDVLNEVMLVADPSARQRITQGIQSGEIQTVQQLRDLDADPYGEIGINDSFRELVQGIGYQGSKKAGEVNIFPGNEERLVKALTLNESESLSVSMNKAGTIVQSPIFPELAGQTQLDDLAVARAAEATSPGGINIVQGISNPAQFAANLPGTRFAQRGNRLDAILVPEGFDADRVVNQYETFGMFEGQTVWTDDGIEATVLRLGPKGAVVQPTAGGAARGTFVESLQPVLSSGQVTEAPQLWDAFRGYADNMALEASRAMGGSLNIRQMETLKTQQLSTWADEFLTNLQIQNPADRERILNYFNKRFVEGYKELAPAETALQHVAQGNYNTTVEANPLTPLNQLDQIAETKGFVAIPDGPSIIMKDVLAETGGVGQASQLRFDSIESAYEWVRNLDRQLPDITPPSEVPLELVGQLQRAPHQGINQNERSIRKIIESSDELAASDPGGAGIGTPPIVAGSAGGDGNVGRLKNQWTDGFLRWRPARRLFSQIDQALFEGGTPTGIAADYDKMGQMVTLHHTDMHPFQDELTDITRKIDTNKLVSGEWFRLMVQGPGKREVAAKALGYNEKHVATFAEMDDLIRKIDAHITGGQPPADVQDLWQYFSHIAKNQSDPATIGQAFDGFPLSGLTKDFADYARTGNQNFRELDPRHVVESYIRARFWQKNMAQPFAEMNNKWLGMSEMEEIKPAAAIMRNWLQIIRYGYSAEDDIALDMMHGALRAFVGPEVSRRQAQELFNFGLNTTHSAMLGFRPHVMARDALQLFLAVPRAGADLANTMRRFMVSEGDRIAILTDAINDGAVTLQSPRTASPGAFVGELERISAAPTELSPTVPIDPAQYGWRMKTAAKVTAATRDMMPQWLRDTRDSPLHAMYFYGKQSEIMRALVYDAGKQKATRALAEFRAGGSVDLDGLMGASTARTFDPAWQREFQKLVAAGDDAGAAKFIGRQLTDATQFKYGILESPMVAKSTTGRVAMQMGNYATQYIQYLRETTSNIYRNGSQGINGGLGGAASDAAKFLLTVGAVTTGLEAASRESGWNFRLMNPFFGLGFTGGPWVALAVDAAKGASSMMREVQTGVPIPAATANTAGQALMRGADMLNPTSGLVRMAEGLGEASNSPYPGRAVGRLLTTGEIGAGPDVNQWMMPQAEAMFQRSIQPQPSPVNASQYGLPPGVFPPQIQSGPMELYNPPSTSPGGNYSPQVPAPGAGPYSFRPTPNAIGPDILNRAVNGDREALSYFDAQDQQFLSQLGPVPPDVRMQVWSSYTIQKVNSQVIQQSRSGVPGMMQPPPRTQGNTNPGTGAMQ